MAIMFYFNNRNTAAQGVRVYRSATTFTETSLPAVYETLAGDAVGFTDEDVTRGDRYFYMFETYNPGDRAFSQLVEVWALGVNTGPGSQLMIAGDMHSGFYGEVPVSDFFNGDQIASAIGLTAGTAYNRDEPWLKFNLDGKTLFVAKKPYRHSLSWNQINAVNAVYGNRTVTHHGDEYIVRLLKTSLTDPFDASSGYDTEPTHGSEWNRLMYPICAPTGNSTYDNITDPSFPGFNTWANYDQGTDLLLLSTAGNGSYSWCQETHSMNASQRASRGHNWVSRVVPFTSSSAASNGGWRPCLELIAQ